MPSESHRLAWLNFETKVLQTRTLLYMGSRAFFSIMYFFAGKEIYDLTKNYLEEGGPKNAERA